MHATNFKANLRDNLSNECYRSAAPAFIYTGYDNRLLSTLMWKLNVGVGEALRLGQDNITIIGRNVSEVSVYIQCCRNIYLIQLTASTMHFPVVSISVAQVDGGVTAHQSPFRKPLIWLQQGSTRLPRSLPVSVFPPEGPITGPGPPDNTVPHLCPRSVTGLIWVTTKYAAVKSSLLYLFKMCFQSHCYCWS